MNILAMYLWCQVAQILFGSFVILVSLLKNRHPGSSSSR